MSGRRRLTLPRGARSTKCRMWSVPPHFRPFLFPCDHVQVIYTFCYFTYIIIFDGGGEAFPLSFCCRCWLNNKNTNKTDGYSTLDWAPTRIKRIAFAFCCCSARCCECVGRYIRRLKDNNGPLLPFSPHHFLRVFVWLMGGGAGYTSATKLLFSSVLHERLEKTMMCV